MVVMTSVTRNAASDGTSRLSRRLARNAVLRALSGLVTSKEDDPNDSRLDGGHDQLEALLRMTESARVLDVDHDIRRLEAVNTLTSSFPMLASNQNNLFMQSQNTAAPLADYHHDVSAEYSASDADSNLMSYLRSLTNNMENPYQDNYQAVEGLTNGLFPALISMQRGL